MNEKVINVLIAHKVRNSRAFDVANRLPCVKCQRFENVLGQMVEPRGEQNGCTFCDGVGHWYLIPTSGHRAYPYWERELSNFALGEVGEPPKELRDHYEITRDVRTEQKPLSAPERQVSELSLDDL